MRSSRLVALAVFSAFVLTACLGAGAPTAEVGDCLQVSELAEEVQDLPQVPCDEPHEAEVYHVFDIEGEGAYDFDAVLAVAQDTCVEEFESFVSIDYWDSELDIYFLHPVADGWAEGDREVLCAVIAPDWDTGGLTMVTGSLEGAAR